MLNFRVFDCTYMHFNIKLRALIAPIRGISGGYRRKILLHRHRCRRRLQRCYKGRSHPCTHIRAGTSHWNA